MFSFVGFFFFFLTLALQSADFSLCVWRRKLVERSITFEEWRYGKKNSCTKGASYPGHKNSNSDRESQQPITQRDVNRGAIGEGVGHD